ncbi:SET domain-containing protein [Aureococcus anophagefferens]|nr:SET domain-containing protein [Aureococcus anophagefferens]
MPLIENDTGYEQAMIDLAKAVELWGGEASMIAGWRTELYDRPTGNSAGTTDRYFYDTSGKKFRSRAEIARALGLSGAPAVRIKGEGMSGALQPGEKPATFQFRWDDGSEEEGTLKSRGLTRDFLGSSKAFEIGGDFREFDARNVLGDTKVCRPARVPRRWRPILENFYVLPATREPSGPSHEWPRCNCAYDAETGTSGCGECSDCVNRDLYVECALDCCGGGEPLDAEPETCRRAFPPMEIFDTGDDNRGFGLRCRVDVKAGTMLGEYRGEVIDAAELQRRKETRDAADPFYIAALGDGLAIDAGRKGAYARFANHSCAPNCALEKWRVGEEPRLVLVARGAIPANTELTYDYNAGGGVADVTVAQQCRCGAPNCAGAIGAKVDKDQLVVPRGYVEDDPDAESDDDDGALRPAATPMGQVEGGCRGWTDDEVDALKEAVAARGTRDWEGVLADYFEHTGRTKSQLVSKWANVKKRDAAAAAAADAANDRLAGGAKKRKAKPGEPAPPKKKKKPARSAPVAAAVDGPSGRPGGRRPPRRSPGRRAAGRRAPARRGALRRGDARRRARGHQDLHCFCRLPEDRAMPGRGEPMGGDAALVNCDGCECWVHPRCVRLAALPDDDAPFFCATCCLESGDDPPFRRIGEEPGRVWKTWAPAATAETVAAALAAFEASGKADALQYARLARDFVAKVGAEAERWAGRCDAALASSAKPKALAELVCEGQTLEVVDEPRMAKAKAALLASLERAAACGVNGAAVSSTTPADAPAARRRPTP